MTAIYLNNNAAEWLLNNQQRQKWQLHIKWKAQRGEHDEHPYKHHRESNFLHFRGKTGKGGCVVVKIAQTRLDHIWGFMKVVSYPVEIGIVDSY